MTGDKGLTSLAFLEGLGVSPMERRSSAQGIAVLSREATLAAPSAPADPASDKAIKEILALTRGILELLSKAPDRTLTVFQFVDHLKTPLEIVSLIVKAMLEAGLVKLVRADQLKGDHAIQLVSQVP